MATHLDLEEQEQIAQLKHFWNQWGTLITLVLTLALGSFAAWNGWQLWQQRQAAQAAGLAQAVSQAIESQDQTRIDQALADLQAQYGKTIQASQAALQVAKAAHHSQQPQAAKAALQWVSEHAQDKGYQDTAKLRLAALLIDEQDLDGAARLLQTGFSAPFQALAADRLGDVLQLQGKTQEAIAAYQQAWQQLDERLQYRAVVGYKLNALGVRTSTAG